jgi:hypothetical protein
MFASEAHSRLANALDRSRCRVITPMPLRVPLGDWHQVNRLAEWCQNPAVVSTSHSSFLLPEPCYARVESFTLPYNDRVASLSVIAERVSSHSCC